MSRVIKAKKKSKKGFIKAEKEKHAIWLITSMEDMIANVEEIKAPFLAADDQMEVIMKIRKVSHKKEDFLKLMEKEVKIFQNHGCEFLSVNTQKEQPESRNRAAKTKPFLDDGENMSNDSAQELENLLEK